MASASTQMAPPSHEKRIRELGRGIKMLILLFAAGASVLFTFWSFGTGKNLSVAALGIFVPVLVAGWMLSFIDQQVKKLSSKR